MAATTVTNVTTSIRTKWETDLLAIADGMLVADKFSNTKVMGRGAGDTLKINRLLRAATTTSAATPGTRVAGSSASSLVSNVVNITPTMWQSHFGFDDDVTLESFLKDKDFQKTIAQQMANSLDYQLMKVLATQGLRHRVDKDGTYQKAFTPDSATSTTIVEADFTEADDFWNGGFVTVTAPNGPGYDETQKVSDFTASSDTLTTAAWANTLSTASDARLTVGTGIVAGDKITSDALIDVAGLHRKLETDKFPGGVLHGFLDAAQEADLWIDTDFINNANYDASQRYANYRLVRWLDMELLVSSNVYRESVAGAESTTGVVYVAPIFGANSYCLVKWGMGQGGYGVKFYFVNEPDSSNLTLNETYISWKAYTGMQVLRATSVIDLMTGATDQALII